MLGLLIRCLSWYWLTKSISCFCRRPVCMEWSRIVRIPYKNWAKNLMSKIWCWYSLAHWWLCIVRRLELRFLWVSCKLDSPTFWTKLQTHRHCSAGQRNLTHLLEWRIQRIWANLDFLGVHPSGWGFCYSTVCILQISVQVLSSQVPLYVPIWDIIWNWLIDLWYRNPFSFCQKWKTSS